MEDLDLIRYVNPQGPLPGLAGTKSGSLLVMGTAPCLWEDLERYGEHEGDRMGINEASQFFMAFHTRPLHHAVSLHPEFLWAYCGYPDYKGAHYGFPPVQSHSQLDRKTMGHPMNVWPLMRDGGTSGLFGVMLGLLMGYERIILAGMPQDGTGYFYYPGKLVTQHHHQPFVDEWMLARDTIFKGRVTSLSGNTAIWLGEPS